VTVLLLVWYYCVRSVWVLCAYCVIRMLKLCE